MRIGSPYTPSAGAMPPYLAGRDELLDDADRYLQSVVKGFPQRPIIYYGLRGVGKTVLLNKIEEKADELDILYEHIEISERLSFLIQITNKSKKMIHTMSMAETAKDFAKKALGILQAFNVTYNPNDQTLSAGVSEISPYIATGILSDDLTDMFVSMGKTAVKAQKAICFFIDEIQYMKKGEMEALVNALHRVNQLRLPIFIFGAGLPKVLRILVEVKSYSERMFRYVEVGELPLEAAREAIEEPAKQLGVSYTESAVKEIMKWTKGYPFFIQELCSVVWDYTDGDTVDETQVEHLIPTFLERLDTGFFKARFDRCTKKEHDFLFAMVKCGELPCTIANVAKFLKKSVSTISPLRAQLINKGIIYPTGHGEIDFTVPLFDEYLKRINPDLIIERG